MEKARKINCKALRLHLTGMTLIELLLAVAIVGILAFVATGAYTSKLKSSARNAAMSDLLMLQMEVEKSWDGAYHWSSLFNGQQCKACLSDQANYTFTISSAGASYTVTAVPKGNQQNDSCGTLSVKGSGERLPANCW